MTTLTLENIPDELYERLKASAAAHRRSLNNEAIACLGAALLPKRRHAEEQLERVRALRRQLAEQGILAGDIESMKREGRA